MNDFNLNLDDYELQDILDLFNINLPITFTDLKEAKKTVLRVHPDKSNLPSKFFLFYTEALKILVHVYSFSNKSNDQRNILHGDKCENEKLDPNILRFSQLSLSNKAAFSETFNKLFENSYIPSEFESNGYSNEMKQSYKNDNETFEEKKQRLKTSMVIYEEPQNITKYSNVNCDITGEKTDDYTVYVGKQLKLEDLKNTYNETIFPIDESHINNMKVYSNIQEIKFARQQQNTNPHVHSEDILRRNELNDNEASMRRAFKLHNIDQANLKNQNNVLRSLYRIVDK